MAINKRDRTAYRKEYYLKNRDKFLKERKEYYENNKELVQESNKEYEKAYIQTPKGKYSIQKRKASRRGIEWNLTFEEWWNIWESSGKWTERGCSGDNYVMCRHQDKGAYAVGNVRIDTASNNVREINLDRNTDGRFLCRITGNQL